MRVRDERAWWDQLSELNADEASRVFRDFLLAWVDGAEAALGSGRAGSPREAMLASFGEVESERGHLSVEWLAQMLIVVVQHWFHGGALWESLSVWERRVVDQMVAVKVAEQQSLEVGEREGAGGGGPEGANGPARPAERVAVDA